MGTAPPRGGVVNARPRAGKELCYDLAKEFISAGERSEFLQKVRLHCSPGKTHDK